MANMCTSRLGEPGGQCSGQGSCVLSADNLTAFCNCAWPFANVGDFATDPSVDCGIHLLAVRGMWGATGTLHILIALVTIRLIIVAWRCKSPLTSVEFSCAYLALIMSACLASVGVLEASAVYPGERSIGTDPVTTILFVIGSSSFWLMSNIYNTAVVRLCIKQAGMFSHQHRAHVRALKLLEVWLFVMTGLCFAACVVVLGFLFSSTNLDQVFASIHFCLLGFAICINGVVIKIAIDPLIKQIDLVLVNSTDAQGSLSRKKLQSARDAFNNIYNTAIKPLPFHILFAILFGAVPMLTRKSAYWLPIAWLGPVPLLIPVFIVWTAAKKDGKNRFGLIYSSSGTGRETSPTIDKPTSLRLIPRVDSDFQRSDHQRSEA